MEAIERWLQNLSIENVKIRLMKNAYGTRSSIFSRFDPRISIVWYLLFVSAPWFIYNKRVLVGLLFYMILMAVLSKVNWLMIVLLSTSVLGNIMAVGIGAVWMQGDSSVIVGVLIVTLKLVIVALATLAAFSGMDPERFGDALLSLGVPGKYGFAISYGYRMLPIMVEEYNDIIHSFRLRGKGPATRGFLNWRYIRYMAKIAVLAFYPMILNMAKRLRTTVEALETKGFSYSLYSIEAKKLRLSYLKIGITDILFILLSVVILFSIVYMGSY